ncbi:MAG: SAM-dependent chlorinase/fluorinase [Pirellulales bacterium]|nr:SAM-dependent chlorinase/fluorinase [Pirellulales bacterium]
MTRVITLTTDFGEGSPYVAQMKGVILSIEPAAVIVDISHAIAAQNVRQGALVLDEVCDRFPPGTIHVAVIDPGVGTARRLVYCQAGERALLGPDNGLFSRIARRSPLATVTALENPRFWLPEVSPTFHGRDILAPVAARLIGGLDPRQLGSPVERLVELEWPQPRISGDTIAGEIIAIDSFGNAITNIGNEHLARWSDRGAIKVQCSTARAIRLVRTYGERATSDRVALIGSGGMLEVAVVGGSASQELGLKVGDRIEVRGGV